MKKANLIGNKFGRLIVVAEVERRVNKKIIWRCLCDCGNEKEVIGADLIRGATQSCGCKKAEITRARLKVHGMTHTQAHLAWVNMRARCYGQRPDSKHYKERNIEVCQRWRDSFINFFEDMGNPPSKEMTIDRIDVNGNYDPSNCVWSTRKQQTRNRRCTKKVTFRGESVVLYTLAERFGMNGQALYQRIFNQKWDVEKAISTPFNPRMDRSKIRKPNTKRS